MPDLPDYFQITPEGWENLRSEWFDAKCKERDNDPVLIGQELQIQYLASGSPRFDVSLLASLLSCIRPPEKVLHVAFSGREALFSESDTGALYVFSHPKPGHSYVIGADSASGTANDRSGTAKPSKSSFVVLDTTDHPHKYEVVATFQSSQLDPGHFARLLGTMAEHYNQALLNPETSGPGVATLTALIGSGHETPIYIKLAKQRRSDPDAEGHHWRLGFNTGERTRPLLEKALSDYLPVTDIADARIHSELLTYTWQTTPGGTVRGKAAPGCNDDLVISLGLAIVAADQNYGLSENQPISRLSVDEMLDSYRSGGLQFEDVLRLIREGK